MPEPDYDALDLPSTDTLPVAAERGARHDGARHRQQPRRTIIANEDP